MRWSAIITALAIMIGPTPVWAEVDWPAEGYWAFSKRNKVDSQTREGWEGSLVLSTDVSALDLTYYERFAGKQKHVRCIYKIKRDEKGRPVSTTLSYVKGNSNLQCIDVEKITFYDENGWIGISHIKAGRGELGYLTSGSALKTDLIWRTEFGAPDDMAPVAQTILDLSPGLSQTVAEANLLARGFVGLAPPDSPVPGFMTLGIYGRDPDMGLKLINDDKFMVNPMASVPDYRDVIIVAYAVLENGKKIVATVRREMLFREGAAPSLSELQSELSDRYGATGAWGESEILGTDWKYSFKIVNESAHIGYPFPSCGVREFNPLSTDPDPIDLVRLSVHIPDVFGGGALAFFKISQCTVGTEMQVSAPKTSTDAGWMGIEVVSWRLIRWVRFQEKRSEVSRLIKTGLPEVAKGSGPLPEL